MMDTIKFRMAAKTDVGLVRQNNEDNFQASSDLNCFPMRWVNNEICALGTRGALLVVADGMGGMNAGEVASEIAIETVKQRFRPENITDEVVRSRFSIEKFMNSAIEEADAHIKREAKNNPSARGMGTTIVIGWLLDGKLYVSWCGDSRAYVYNPRAGLHQISKDHSYVQSLVDKGAISREDAFDYPESNIITRCLSDSSTKAKPESLLSPYDLCDGDVVLLCTDGLSGMIRDNEMERVIRENERDMDACTDRLIQAACDAEGSDNITICVAQIIQGARTCDAAAFEAYDKRLAGPARQGEGHDDGGPSPTPTPTPTPFDLYKGIAIGVAACCLLALVLFGGWKLYGFLTAEEAEPTSAAMSIKSCDGTELTVERSEGHPMVGDKASPNGRYVMEGDTVIVVSNGKIVSIMKEVKEEVEDTHDSQEIRDGSLGQQFGKAVGAGRYSSVGKPGDRDATGTTKPADSEVQLTEVNVEGNSDGITTAGTAGGGSSSGNAREVEYKRHTVKKSETLRSIARKYRVKVDAIRECNKDRLKGDSLQIGMELSIPIIKRQP